MRAPRGRRNRGERLCARVCTFLASPIEHNSRTSRQDARNCEAKGLQRCAQQSYPDGGAVLKEPLQNTLKFHSISIY